MNYILGGGVAGMTLALYLKDFKIFDANPMGQLNSKYILGPRLITKDEYTKEFFNTFTMSYSLDVATAYVGYESDGQISRDPDHDFKKKYSLITRGHSDYEQSFLSSGQNAIEHYIFKGVDDSYGALFRIIEERLRNNSRFIYRNVEKIDIKDRTVHTSNIVYNYDNLVNTLNFKIFRKLLVNNTQLWKDKLETELKCFYVTEYTAEDRKLAKDYYYIYSVDGEYTRRTFQHDHVIYETVQPHQSPTVNGATINGAGIIEKIENIPIQIKKSLNIKNAKGIPMFGRYAQWSHRIKFNDSLAEVERVRKAVNG